MTSSQAFSMQISVPDGDPDPLRMVERANWIGKALVFPRSLTPEVALCFAPAGGANYQNHYADRR